MKKKCVRTPFLALFFLLLPCICFGYGLYDDDIGYRGELIGGGTEFINEGGYYIFDSPSNSYYHAYDIPTGSYYGIIFKGEIGSATTTNSHYLGNFGSTAWQKFEPDGFDNLITGDQMYVAIVNSDMKDDLIDFMCTGDPLSDYEFGMIGWKWGGTDNIHFWRPKGAYPQNNYAPTFEGQFTASSTWNYIQVDLRQHDTTATSSIVDNQFFSIPIENLGEPNTYFFHGIQGLDNACYSYRARFIAQYGGLPPNPVIIDYSDFYQDEEWIFCVGTESMYILPSESEPVELSFSGLINALSNKPPFGYFTSVKNAIEELNASTTPAFELSDFGDLADFFETIRTIFAWLLWIIFAIWVIRRVGDFDF